MIEVKSLSYAFPLSSRSALDDVVLQLPTAARALLVGGNGAGKTTLLRCLAGRIMAGLGQVRLHNCDPFRDAVPGIVYLGTEWATSLHVRSDVVVRDLVQSAGGDEYEERAMTLLRILDVDVDWHMNAISDGERRRVQLTVGLLRPWQTLLLDEVTVDLDVRVRRDFMQYLQEESETRQVTIVYATHIFDGMQEWPTHLIHIKEGTVLKCLHKSECLELKESEGPNSALWRMVLEWLDEDSKTASKGRGEKLK